MKRNPNFTRPNNPGNRGDPRRKVNVMEAESEEDRSEIDENTPESEGEDEGSSEEARVNLI